MNERHARRLPAPAPATASVPLDDGAVVFEPRAAEIHVLNGPAAVVWAACCDGTGRGALLDELVEATSRSRHELADQVDACLDQLLEHHLVVQGPPAGGPQDLLSTSWVRSEPAGAGPHRVRLAVLDEVIELCATFVEVVDHARANCADLVTADEPTLWMAVHDEDDGRVRLVGPRAGSRFHDGRGALLAALVSELNVATVCWTGGVALHAGGVRHSTGTIVGLLGESGAGKSTLVGALVQAGWDYVTDEALAIRPSLDVLAYPKPLALDAASRSLLGVTAPGDDVAAGALRHGTRSLRGDVGPPGLLVLLDRHDDPTGVHALEEVAPADALTSLSPYALNLPASGSVGLTALARSAQAVRCVRLAYADLHRAVELLTAATHGRIGQ